MEDYSWAQKHYLRSVDQLRLWNNNPRLNPDEKHISISDFAEDLTADQSDKQALFDLAKSIVDRGFLGFDPIVVWQDENEKFYVAEGNRRVLVLKLLRHPEKAPKSIRAYFRRLSEDFDSTSVDKISVIVAPSFDDAEWYINQRNSMSSLARPWSRLQQQRWIYDQYKKYGGDIDILKEKTGLTASELDSIIRMLKIRDYINTPKVKNLLTSEEFNDANSHKFPMTVLERFFDSSIVKSKWGIIADGSNIKITADEDSFSQAYAQLIRSILGKTDVKIDTRTITTSLNDILSKLPSVNVNDDEWELGLKKGETPESVGEEQPSRSVTRGTRVSKKGDPNRNHIILTCYEINTDSYRLQAIFDELKKIPFRYTACIAASMRVFLDLAILKYIESENLKNAICAENKAEFKKVILQARLEYIKQNCQLSKSSKNIIGKLLNPYDNYSLDILNGFIHSSGYTQYLNKQYLNGFWDFLFPFYSEILDIKEK
ncbi:MAG: ParB N-terminal domain-containing protein [Alistipes sp.]|nr:ParB N-terminal domain-containing protein [Alistipes sp.]